MVAGIIGTRPRGPECLQPSAAAAQDSPVSPNFYMCGGGRGGSLLFFYYFQKTEAHTSAAPGPGSPGIEARTANHSPGGEPVQETVRPREVTQARSCGCRLVSTLRRQ